MNNVILFSNEAKHKYNSFKLKNFPYVVCHDYRDDAERK